MSMYSDSTSYVRVTRYYKRVKGIDPVSGFAKEYRVYLDWGIGVVDGTDGVYVYGSPYQLFSNNANAIYGDPNKDSRVWVDEEELPISYRKGAAQTLPGDLHFKHPNA